MTGALLRVVVERLEALELRVGVSPEDSGGDHEAVAASVLVPDTDDLHLEVPREREVPSHQLSAEKHGKPVGEGVRVLRRIPDLAGAGTGLDLEDVDVARGAGGHTTTPFRTYR